MKGRVGRGDRVGRGAGATIIYIIGDVAAMIAMAAIITEKCIACCSRFGSPIATIHTPVCEKTSQGILYINVRLDLRYNAWARISSIKPA